MRLFDMKLGLGKQHRFGSVGAVLGLALAGLGHPSAEAEVYFLDGFETQSDPTLVAPPVGVRWSDNGIGNNYDVISSPTASGAAALRINRDGSTDVPNLLGVGTAGAFVAGNVLEYFFRVNSVLNPDNGISHNFNGNIQVSVSTASGAILANFGTLNGGSENYYASDGANSVDLGVAVPRNTAAYDTVRLVLSLTEPAAGQIGGTYEVFVDIDDTDGITTNSLGTYSLMTQTLPVVESTNPGIRFARGPSSSNVLIDDIRIATVPEPGSMALLAIGGAMFLARSRRGR